MMEHAVNASKRFETTDSQLRAALDTVVHENIPKVLLGLSGLYAFFALTHFLALRASFGSEMILIAGTSSIAYAIAWLVIRKWRYPVSWSHRIGFAVILFGLIDAAINLYISKDAQQTPSLSILLIAAGCFFLSTRWMIRLVLVTFG